MIFVEVLWFFCCGVVVSGFTAWILAGPYGRRVHAERCRAMMALAHGRQPLVRRAHGGHQ